MDIIEKTAYLLKVPCKDVFLIWSVSIRGVTRADASGGFQRWEHDKYVHYDIKLFCEDVLEGRREDVKWTSLKKPL